MGVAFAEVNQENVLTTLAQSWLLRCVAVELRVTSLGKQRSHLQRLITLLAEDAPLLSSRGKIVTSILVQLVYIQCKI